MLLNITLTANAVYPIIMVLIAAGSFWFNIYLAKRSNSKFKQEEMKKKLDTETFKDYRSVHAKEHTDMEMRITHHFDTRFDDFKDFMLTLRRKSG